MNKDIAKRSHAQNRFLRREDNRAGNHPAKGTPIAGELTPTEIAHKARRKARRLAIHTQNVKSIPFQIESITAKLAMIEKTEPKSAEQKKEMDDRVFYLNTTRKTLEKQLRHSEQILSKLTVL